MSPAWTIWSTPRSSSRPAGKDGRGYRRGLRRRGEPGRTSPATPRPTDQSEIIVEKVVREQIVPQVVPAREMAVLLDKPGEELAFTLGEELGGLDAKPARRSRQAGSARAGATPRAEVRHPADI